ncbi:Gfo/Idh/MocA family protein [Actinomadura rayongensis]|uniref:Gfo/Idh/MocA family oxidoreductase n=2 Tax=Actinomadura rayongensis TaxID=1429076 RepID=A0A6I4W2U8_9ACTN|nr:Gfo/Idh/MocA family oxidoreductase [Actinomadura rayongensis]MXQ63040.1 Gfo/Idh/MocA family oxidoreductase [Actinomadura rayongensis]
MTPPLRIGVIGCADIAVRRLLPAMAAAPGVVPVAVASRSAERAAETARAFGCRPVHGYAGLLAADDVDAVYVPLPAALHAEWVERALLAGKHVLAEKPLTLSSERTAELFALARSRGLVLMENVMFVHHGQHAAVRALVSGGAIGELRAFHAAFTIPRLAPGDIRYDADLGGGALWDVGVYPVRAALHFLGPDLTVVGSMLSSGRVTGVDTLGAALLRTPDGVAAHLTFGLEHAYVSTYTLHGGEGRITVDRAFTPPADHRPRVRVERRSGVEEPPLDAEDQVVATVTAFARAVAAGTCDGAASLRQAELLDELRDAAALTTRRS